LTTWSIDLLSPSRSFYFRIFCFCIFAQGLFLRRNLALTAADADDAT
jgi:hypothetical protein